jgi:hypothetical protein
MGAGPTHAVVRYKSMGDAPGPLRMGHGVRSPRPCAAPTVPQVGRAVWGREVLKSSCKCCKPVIVVVCRPCCGGSITGSPRMGCNRSTKSLCGGWPLCAVLGRARKTAAWWGSGVGASPNCSGSCRAAQWAWQLAGPDGVTAEFIRHACTEHEGVGGKTVRTYVMSGVLTRVFNCILAESYPFRAWRVSALIPVPNPKGRPDLMDDYRGIAVDPVLATLCCCVFGPP